MGDELSSSYKLLFLGHRSLIKNIRLTAVINTVKIAFNYVNDVSYAKHHD